MMLMQSTTLTAMIKLKLELFGRVVKKVESFWLHPLDLYLVFLNRNLFFVETFMKLAAMRQPVTATEAFQFINSTIRSSGLEGKVKDRKEKHCNLIMEHDDEPVSKKYWA
jgi:hypothetical protein